MAAAVQLTWDIDPPRRPSLDDVGGATLEDHASKPPSKATMPYAAQLNQWAKQVERLAALVPSFGVTVTFSGGGAPSVTQFTAMRTTVENADFTVTDNGTGDITIEWPAGTFPTSVLGPMAALNDGTVGGGITAALGANSVRVKTWTGAATPADRSFTIVVR